MEKILIRLTPQQYKEVREIAHTERVSIAELVRQSINMYLAERNKSLKTSPDEEKTKEKLTPVPISEDEMYIFDQEVLQFYRDFKANPKDPE